MQVRSSLHNKKQKSVKLQRTQTNLLISQRKNRVNNLDIKIMKERTPSRSKSNSEKQNAKYKKKQLNSKSKKKKSPIKSKECQGPNSSPIQYQRFCYTKRSPLKSNQKKLKQIHSHRQYEKNCQTSTKLHTERTPVKKISQKVGKQKQNIKKHSKKKQNHLKSKNYKNIQPKVKKLKEKIQNKSYNNQNQQIKIEDPFRKKKKNIPEINTNGPQRKQSYFDQETLQRFNLDNAEYLRRRKITKFQQNGIKQKRKDPSPQNSNILKIVQYRQYGVSTENNLNPALGYRDLQSFRKQQQLKWKIMYLELSQLKITRTPQKIQQIIQQSHKNISQFQIKCKEIVESQVKNNYFIQSPTKIKKALRRQRKSSLENKSLIKTLSDKKLLQQLQNLENFQQPNHIQNQKLQKPSSSSFCLQLQKQLESYSQSNFSSNHNLPFNNIQIQHIPQLQFQKSNQIYLSIQQYLFQEFCQQLLQKQVILHSYLLTCRKNAEQIELKIRCNQIYSIDLFYRLFKFIQQKQFTNQFLDRINTSTRENPLRCLKLLRNYFIENQDQLYQDQNNELQIVLDSDLLNYFQSQGYNSTVIQNQYFYNHCVYRCLNQIIDTLRPIQNSILFSSQKKTHLTHHKSLSKTFDQIFYLFKQLLNVRIGRQEFNEYQVDLLRVAENSYALLDRLLVKEEEQKWRKIQQKILQQKYFLAQYIVNDIFNQEILMIYNEFS